MTVLGFPKRPVSMQEIADAHDTCTFVLGYHLREMTSTCTPTVKLTAMLPHPYVPYEGGGVAHWTDPDVRVHPWLPYEAENRFAFEATANFRYGEFKTVGSFMMGTRDHVTPARDMSSEDIGRRLRDIASSAEALRAKDVKIDYDRRVVTGTFLYLPDHPVVGWVRSRGVMPYEVNGKHVPACGTVYPYKKPVEYVPEGHEHYLAYELCWRSDRGSVASRFGLTEQSARDLVAQWRSQGLVFGSLKDGKVTFASNTGRNATIGRFTGQQHRLDSIDPETGGIR